MPMLGMTCAWIFVFCWMMPGTESNPGIKMLISDTGLKYAANQVADLLSKEILKTHLTDIKGSEPFSYGILNYSFTDIEINGYTRPDMGLQINPSGSFSLSFSEASVAATAIVVCKKAAGAVKFRHTTSVILSIYGVSVFVNANIGLNDFGVPVIQASTCSSSMGSIIASFQGDVNSLYNPIARSKKFRRNLHTALGGMMCGLVTRSINYNGLLRAFNGQPTLHDSAALDLRMSSGLTFGSDFIESSHRGRMVGDWVHEEAPTMFLSPERMLTIGISEATLNSVARVLHDDGFLTTVIPGSEFKDLLPKLKDFYHDNDVQLIISSNSAPVFSITTKGIFLKMEVDGRLVESDKNSSVLASLKMSVNAQLKPLLSHHNLTAAVTAFVPTVKEAMPNSGGEFLKDFAVKLSEEVQNQANGLLKIGLPLPKLKGILYINDYHKPYNRYMSITCDVIYVP